METSNGCCSWCLWITILAAIVGAYAYRRIKWALLPREIKAIEIAKKNIRKGKIIELPFRNIKDRESMFRRLVSDAWNSIGIKAPKLVQPEVVLFASELSAALRTRVTSPKAESMMNTLKSMSIEEAEKYLGQQKVPPEAMRHLLIIVGLIKKESLEVLRFAQLLGDIKDMDIPYSQAEKIVDVIQSMPPSYADSYLKAMVIPEEDRQKLLDLVGVKLFVSLKKIRPPREEKKNKKEKVNEKTKDQPMNVDKIRAELGKIPGLSEDDKESLVRDMERLTLEEQIEILKTLKR